MDVEIVTVVAAVEGIVDVTVVATIRGLVDVREGAIVNHAVIVGIAGGTDIVDGHLIAKCV